MFVPSSFVCCLCRQCERWWKNYFFTTQFNRTLRALIVLYPPPFSHYSLDYPFRVFFFNCCCCFLIIPFRLIPYSFVFFSISLYNRLYTYTYIYTYWQRNVMISSFTSGLCVIVIWSRLVSLLGINFCCSFLKLSFKNWFPYDFFLTYDLQNNSNLRQNIIYIFSPLLSPTPSFTHNLYLYMECFKNHPMPTQKTKSFLNSQCVFNCLSSSPSFTAPFCPQCTLHSTRSLKKQIIQFIKVTMVERLFFKWF